MPPEFTLDSGNTLTQNKFQKWLWDRWLDYCAWLDAYNVENILINGDVVQGINAKDLETLTVNEADQTRFAIECLRPLIFLPSGARRALGVYVTRGSGFHDGKAGERAEYVAREIGAAEVEGQFSKWEWWIEWREKLIYATHHTSTAAVYPLTPLYRQMNEAKVRAAAGWLLPDCDLRSHVHACNALQDKAGRWMATAPAWQLKTAFAHKVAPGSLPDIGGLLLTLDEDQKLEVRKKLYPLPLPRVERAKIRAAAEGVHRQTKTRFRSKS